MDRNNIKVRLAKLGKTQVWLVGELTKRGERVFEAELSRFRRENYMTEKSVRVLALCDEILREHEQQESA